MKTRLYFLNFRWRLRMFVCHPHRLKQRMCLIYLYICTNYKLFEMCCILHYHNGLQLLNTVLLMSVGPRERPFPHLQQGQETAGTEFRARWSSASKGRWNSLRFPVDANVHWWNSLYQGSRCQKWRVDVKNSTSTSTDLVTTPQGRFRRIPD